ncbi:hypothetical protein [Gordonia sihwensis]|uniref:hypothetical protein n=1 Tax=Gordonia sihwensis TaxID=173559 RepID=UPI0005EF63F0|nr:hypothetical protein [Gordonia sihwensis]KJR05983.1 hypothetical protein UG54_15050 [Gordonia sihwensis]
MTAHPDDLAEVERRLEALGAMVRAAAGTGDGIIPPKGSPADLAFEAALDAPIDRKNRRPHDR